MGEERPEAIASTQNSDLRRRLAAVCRVKRGGNQPGVKYWEIIADNLSKAGRSWGCVSAIDSNGRTIWIADAQDGDGKRFAVRADEKLTAFVQLGIGGCTYWSLVIFSISLLCLSLSFVILSTLFLSFVPS